MAALVLATMVSPSGVSNIGLHACSHILAKKMLALGAITINVSTGVPKEYIVSPWC